MASDNAFCKSAVSNAPSASDVRMNLQSSSMDFIRPILTASDLPRFTVFFSQISLLSSPKTPLMISELPSELPSSTRIMKSTERFRIDLKKNSFILFDSL